MMMEKNKLSKLSTWVEIKIVSKKTVGSSRVRKPKTQPKTRTHVAQTSKRNGMTTVLLHTKESRPGTLTLTALVKNPSSED